jgi:hypothetical protein
LGIQVLFAALTPQESPDVVRGTVTASKEPQEWAQSLMIQTCLPENNISRQIAAERHWHETKALQRINTTCAAPK